MNRGFGDETPGILDILGFEVFTAVVMKMILFILDIGPKWRRTVRAAKAMTAKGEKYLLLPGISLLTDVHTVSFNSSSITVTSNGVVETVSLLAPHTGRRPLPSTPVPIHNSLIILSFDAIQDIPGDKANILGDHSIGHSKKRSLYEHVTYSERFPR
jgi:hypothetical protein